MPRQHRRSESGDICVVCCEDIEIFAVGPCDHPICYVCSVRMRVLGKEKYCAVCRTDLDKVVLTKKYGKWSTLQEKIKHGYAEKEFGLCYADKEVRSKVDELLQHKCLKCLDEPPERTFNKLRDHMRREHHSYFCEICFKHLQKFTHELKVYSRADLAKHRRVGDSDDAAYKGHPLCEFCDERFLDDEYLHRHLRKNHFWCHICEKDGKQLYFHDYVNLRDHFREEHHLCEEDMCKYEQYTSVFRSEIDLQAHIASKHAQKMTKAQVRQARQLEVDLVFNRPATQGRHITGQDYSEVQASEQKFRRNRGKGRGNSTGNRQEEQNIQAAITTSLARMDENPTSQQNKIKENATSEKKQAVHVLPEADFPLLNGAAPKTSQNTSPKASPKATRKAEGYVKKATGLDKMEDFPVLSGSTSKAQQNGTTTNAPNTNQFYLKQTKKTEAFNKKAKGFNNLDDFPTLGKSSKAQQNGVSDVNVPSIQSSPKITRKVEGLKKKPLDDNEDFPTLGKPSRPQQNGTEAYEQSNPKNASKQTKKQETADKKSKSLDNLDDYPTLGKASRPQLNGTEAYEQSNPKNASKQTKKQETTDKKSKSLDNLDDYPTLGKASRPQQNGTEAYEQSIPKNASKQMKKQETADKKSKTLDNLDDFPTLGNASRPQQNGSAEACEQSNPKNASKQMKKQETADKKSKTLDNLDDFPTLGKASKSHPKNPQPGFSDVAKEHPPQTSQVRPPPGLQSNVSSDISENSPQVSTQFSEKLDNILSPKEKPKSEISNEKKENKPYVKGNQLRNQNLIENIKALLEYDVDKFVEFKQLSGKFRQGLCSAEAYYNDCMVLFGPDFGLIFNELVNLLPDQDKQEQLLKLHNDAKILAKQDGKQMQQGGGKKMLARHNAWGPLQTNSAPVTNETWRKTRSEVEFPSLPSAGPRQIKPARIYKPTTNLALKSAWVRGK